ncbi:DUF2637 domain-containing protein [Kitasatospora sp. HPMI-4]|uniref:DUF2637 domain-containing protein n=1 Tax=Kitasatospora sp. HPMI-4 TaxID=3448443 RepID=UPI003F1B7E57
MSTAVDIREQRRADRAAERAEARADRSADRDFELQLKVQEAEQRRADEAAKAEQARRDADAERKRKEADRKAEEERRRLAKAERAERRAKALGWLKAHPADAFVALVMACSVVPAVISQVGALTSAKVEFVLAALFATMLEGGAWAVTFMGQQAEAAGRPTGKYRTSTWLLASIAAGVNFWHGLDGHPVWVAAVMGASSLFAVGIWDLRTHGGHGRTKADRKREKEREEHAKRRRELHQEVADVAEEIKAASPFGVLDDEAAFAAAWTVVHGGEQGMTVELRATELAANQQLMTELETELGPDSPVVAAALEARRAAKGSARSTVRAARARMLARRAGNTPAELADEPASQLASKPREQAPRPAQQAEKPQVAANKPPAVRAPQVAAQDPRPKQVKAARTLAAETARAATPEEAEKEKESAREWLRARRAEGANPGWKGLSEETSRGETWCRARLREVEAEQPAGPSLHLVPGGH